MLNKLLKELEKNSSKEKAEIANRFFKTGIGEYSEGDIFIGISVPDLRKIANKYLNLSLNKLQELLRSKIHEHRMIAIVILTEKYKRGTERDKENIFGFYLMNSKNVNNWDLVDLSAPIIVGDFLFEKEKKPLYELLNSDNLWKKRIAIVSTYGFIKKQEFEDALVISEILLSDKHDLIHKAVGWMLREIGKRDEEILEKFLKFHYKKIPRTTLRYSIEKFDEEKRKKILRGEFR